MSGETEVDRAGIVLKRLAYLLYYFLLCRRRDAGLLSEMRVSGMISDEYYRAQVQGTPGKRFDPVMHYVDFGHAKGLDPSVYFETQFYLLQNPDVASSGMNALCHFIRFGKQEGRRPTSLVGVRELESCIEPDVESARTVGQVDLKSSDIAIFPDSTATLNTGLAQYDDSTSMDIIVVTWSGSVRAARLAYAHDWRTHPNVGVRIISCEASSAAVWDFDGVGPRHCKVYAAGTRKRSEAIDLIREAVGDSDARYLAFASDRVLVGKGWSNKLLSAARANSKAAIVGPLTGRNAGNLFEIENSYDGQYSKPDEIQAIRDQFVELWSTSESFTKVPALDPHCFLIKRRILDEIPGFYESLGSVGMNTFEEYLRRTVDAGWDVGLSADTYVEVLPVRADAHASPSGRQMSHGIQETDWAPQVFERSQTGTRLKDAFKEVFQVCQPTFVPVRQTLNVVFLLPCEPGGGGVHSVVQEAAEMGRHGISVKIAVPSTLKREYAEHYPEKDIYSVFLFYSGVKELRSHAEKANLIIATIHSSVSLLSELAKERPSVTCGYYVQDFEPYFFPNFRCKSHPDTNAFKEALRSYTKVKEAFLFAKTRWLQHVVLRWTGTRTFKVAPSIDHGIFYPHKDRGKNERIRISSMIRFSSTNRAPWRTLRILKHVAETFGGLVEIGIFGTSAENEEQKRLCEDFDIKIHGVLERRNVAVLLRDSDIFVDFSEYQAFGRTGLEAMACGCAVVLPDCGGADEYAIDNVNALLVDTTRFEECVKALRSLIESSDLRERLARNAMETSRDYSLEKSVTSEIILFNSMIAAHKAPS